jgi:hypothetical protein
VLCLLAVLLNLALVVSGEWATFITAQAVQESALFSRFLPTITTLAPSVLD